MPLLNVYLPQDIAVPPADEIGELRSSVAKVLTVEGRNVLPEEVTVRLLPIADGSQTTSDLDVEVTAYNLPTRVEQKNELANEISLIVRKAFKIDGDVKAWLILTEIGTTST